MPCSDGGYTQSFDTQEQLDKLTRMLCGVLTKLEAVQGRPLLEEMADDETLVWWIQHKEWDRQRREAETVQLRTRKK